MSQPDFGVRHSSTTELRGLDVVPDTETHSAALNPVSPNNNHKGHDDVALEAEGEVNEIEQLEDRVEELE